MKILYLAHRLPYPPNKGEKIRSYHHLRHLARAHEVDLVSFVDRPADTASEEPLREICRRVCLVPLDRGRALARGTLSLARGRSLSEGYFGSPAMRRALRETTAAESYDVVWVGTPALLPARTAVVADRRVVDFVDVDSEKWGEFARRSPWPLRRLYLLEARRLRRLEANVAADVDASLFVSTQEADLFRTFAPPGSIAKVVPNGVDSAYFDCAERVRPAAAHVLFTGTLDYFPNVDAVEFLLHDVLPLVRREIPAVKFTAAGHRPAARLVRAARHHDGAANIAGSVADIRPFFAAATAFAAPIRFGRGVKNKVLEAMASGLPVVAGRCAVAGLEVEAGRDYLAAETAPEFAAALSTLWRRPELAQAIAANGLAYVRERHRWETCLRSLDDCLAALGRHA